MRIAKILALVVVRAAPASLDAQQPLDRIPFFVTTAATADGFTELAGRRLAVAAMRGVLDSEFEYVASLLIGPSRLLMNN
jgi:hypothetical protein